MTASKRPLAGLLLAGTFVVAISGVASAHAGLASSDPASGASLDDAPVQVILTFTEPPDPKLSVVHVLDVNGTQVESGPAEALPGGKDQLRIGLPEDLSNGVYTVSWRVVSEADGHTTAGAFGFGVGVPPGSAIEPSVPAPTTPSPSLASVVGKVALYAGLALLFASVVLGLWAFGGAVPARRPVLWTGAALAALGAVAMLLAEGATLDVSLGDLLSSNTGRDFIWLSVAVGVTVVTALVAGRRSDRVSLAVVGSPRRHRSPCSGSTSWRSACGWAASRSRSCWSATTAPLPARTTRAAPSTGGADRKTPAARWSAGSPPWPATHWS